MQRLEAPPVLTVLTWLWSQPDYRSKFTATHVEVLARMVARHLPQPYRFVCISDTPIELDGVIWLPTPAVPRVTLPGGRPNCYRRLWTFSAEACELLGPRVLALDLDCVITGDLTPLVTRDENMIMWGDTARNTQYNGSLLLLRTGTCTQVWDSFIKQPKAAPVITRSKGMIGSDQAWISHTLPGRPMWGAPDGIYSFRNQLAMRPKRDLPNNARIVFFHGKPDPWEVSVQRDFPWIKQHYC